MNQTMEQLYQQRLARYVTALRNEQPDRVPIRPFVAEFTAKYAGFTCQAVTHDYTQAFETVLKCARDFDWDAMVANMVYVWTGLTQAAGLRYYAIPGIGLPPDVGFNYVEPAEEKAFMQPEEYDALIADPTGFLYETWLPRVSEEVGAGGKRASIGLVKSSMAMLSYFTAFGPQVARMRTETGTVSAIAGIFKAPLDILADKFRGYLGLLSDLETQPDKVLKACEALMPHLCHVGLTTADPAGLVPIGFWMHRGCVPFINPQTFNTIYWPTLKPIIEEFWKQGHQTLFYGEGKWQHHFESFTELPARSMVFHVDRDDVFDAHRRLHHKFALSGGVPNTLLSFGKPAEVCALVRRILTEVAPAGGYILDSGAILQNDASIENMRALTATAREYGVYGDGQAVLHATAPAALPSSIADRARLTGMTGRPPPHVGPGVCIPWADKVRDLPPITGDADLARRIWEQVDAFGNMYIWQLLLSF